MTLVNLTAPRVLAAMTGIVAEGAFQDGLSRIGFLTAVLAALYFSRILISGVIFSKKVRPYFRASQKKMGILSGKLQDNLSGIHEIQSFGRESYETEKVDEKNFDHVRAMLHALKVSAVFHPTVEFVSSLGTVLVRLGGVCARMNRASLEAEN